MTLLRKFDYVEFAFKISVRLNLKSFNLFCPKRNFMNCVIEAIESRLLYSKNIQRSGLLISPF